MRTFRRPLSVIFVVVIVVVSGILGNSALADYPRPDVVSRTQWGCPDGSSSPWDPGPAISVNTIFVHHSAGRNSSSDWESEVRDIWSSHSRSTLLLGNGWLDIGYHYLIDPNGVVYQGRAGTTASKDVEGAATYHFNSDSVSICLLGTFNNVAPTSAALSSLKSMLAWKCSQKGIDPEGTHWDTENLVVLSNISGHRDTNLIRYDNGDDLTECPGESLYRLLPDIRQEVAALLSSNNQASSEPLVDTLSADQISSSSIRFRGRIRDTGGLSITERRFDWGSSQPLNQFTANVQTSGNEFYYTLNGLSPGTTVYFRAWAENAEGWGFGSIRSATTSSASGADLSAPLVEDLRASPSDLPLGGTTTIEVTASEVGGGGLDRIELWRAKNDSSPSANWTMISSKSASGSGPVTKEFSDTPPSEGTFYYGVHVVDQQGNVGDERESGVGPVPVMVGSSNSAQIELLGFSIDDDNSGGSSGNGDGVPNPTETIEVDVEWRNAGSGTAYDIECQISTSDPYVSIVDDEVGRRELGVGESRTSGDFDLVISEDCPDFHEVSISWTVRWNGGQTSGTWQFTVRVVPCITTQTDPEEGAAFPFPIEFRWNLTGPNCPTNLRLVFSNADGGGAIAHKSVTGTSNTVSLAEWVNAVAPQLPASEVYYWSIGYIDGQGQLRALTPFRDFRPVLPPACTIAQQLPSDGAAITFPQTFSWSSSGSCPTEMRLVFSNVTTGANLIWKAVSGSSNTVSMDEFRFAVAAHLPPSSTYYWSIGHQDSSGQLRALTPWRSFTVNIPPLPQADQVSPGEGEELPFPATFAWSFDGSAPQNLRLVFSDKTDGTSLRIRTVSGSDVLIDPNEWENEVAVHLPAASTYYWSIGYLDELGKLRALSPWRSFVPVLPPSCDITHAGPLSGGWLGLPAIFRWTMDGTCPGNLRLVFSDDTSGQSVVSKPVIGLESEITAEEWESEVASQFPSGSLFYWSIGYTDPYGVLRPLTEWTSFYYDGMTTIPTPEVDVVGDDVHLNFQSRYGQTYGIWSSENLSTWQLLEGNIEGTGFQVERTLSGAVSEAPKQFYSVKQE